MTGFDLATTFSMSRIYETVFVESVRCTLCENEYIAVNKSPCTHCGWTLNFLED